MNLFETGDFILHNGAATFWRLNAECFSSDDLIKFAQIVLANVWFHGIDRVVGVPTGGEAFAEAIRRLRTYPLLEDAAYVPDHPGAFTLIVDDVLTTGASMQNAARRVKSPIVGAVIFARPDPYTGKFCVPDWVHPLFTISPMM